MASTKLNGFKKHFFRNNLCKRQFSRTVQLRKDPSLNLPHYINNKRASFQHRYPSSDPLTLQHACNVASSWQSLGMVNMLELRKELIHIGFMFDAWPQSNNYGDNNNKNNMLPAHDVLIARFPNHLRDKYGDPSAINILQTLKNVTLKDSKTEETLNNNKKTKKLSNEEEWNKEFWSEDIDIDDHNNTDTQIISSKNNKKPFSSADTFLNYPMPGDDHYNDNDSPLITGFNGLKGLKSFKRKKKLKILKNHNYNNYFRHDTELLSRGHVFIFSSGCIVTWGYNGADRDWIDSFIKLYQDKRGWPSFDGFKLPFYISTLLYMNGGFIYPKDMKIARTDFLNLNWIIKKKLDVNINNKFGRQLPNDIEKWNCDDVQLWLKTINLHKYIGIFSEQEIDGKLLLNLVSNSNKNSSVSQSQRFDVFVEKILLAASSLKDYSILISELNKLNINKEDIFSDEDVLCLPPNNDLETLYSISYALAQASRLEVLKIAVNYYQKNLMVLTERLAKKGSITMIRKKHWSKLVHHCEMLRDLLFDFGVQPILTQVPHFIEQRSSSDAQHIYNAVLDYLDFEEDLDDITEQIDQLKNRYESDWEACRDYYSFKLEIIIIMFFLIETYEIWSWGLKELSNKLITIFHHKQLYVDQDDNDGFVSDEYEFLQSQLQIENNENNDKQ